MDIIKHEKQYTQIKFTKKFILFLRDFSNTSYQEKHLYIYENKNQQRHSIARLIKTNDKTAFAVTSNRKDEELLKTASRLFDLIESNKWCETDDLEI